MSEVIEQVKARFPDAVLRESEAFGQQALVVDPAKWSAVAKWLATEGGFGFLSDLCGVHWLGTDPAFEVVYNLTNFETRTRLTIKVPVAGDPPTTGTVTDLWPTANWLEREAFDMFGITFEGHPNLERILMPDEWEGHPLRKDYSVGKVPIEFKHLSPGF